MAQNSNIRIRRLDDGTLFRIFNSAFEAGSSALEAARDAKKLSGSDCAIGFDFDTVLPWKLTEEDLENADPGQYALGTISLSFEGTYQVNRQQRQSRVYFAVSRGTGDSLTDTLTISSSVHGSEMRGDGEQSVQRSIHRALSKVMQPVAPEDGGLVSSLSNISQAFETTYQRIALELSGAVAAVSKERAEQITEFQEERKRLQEEIAVERDEILAAANQANERERAELKDEKQRLAEEWKKLETSSHKDARRKQFQALQDDLRKSIGRPVTDTGQRLTRLLVFFALMCAGVYAGYFAYLSFDVANFEASVVSPAESGSSLTAAVLLVLRSALLTAASLSAFVGAAAWLRYFYNRDMQAQEELLRFRNDMARASWVMDAALEIRKEHDEEIPPEWINGVTQGLFAASKRETLEEGAQALAALMGLSASASFGPGGPQVQLSRKGRKAISGAVDEA
ncbi:hypothetical protein [Pseudooceanicola sp. 200-1SW]|uniref:hypothetical protein n=1 Tax=Pseudooceanicola sp. 200-1SW TaxID=3425949 RepID=UPI003D7F61FA